MTVIETRVHVDQTSLYKMGIDERLVLQVKITEKIVVHIELRVVES